MKPHQSFLDFLNKFISISQPEYDELLKPYLITRKFDKKEIITHRAVVENYFNYIESGLARKYYKKGSIEINTQISHEGHIIHAQESFHSRTPSEYIVEAIEPCVLTSITFDDLEGLYRSSHKMEHLGRVVITATMVLKDRRQSQLVKMTPRERFINFVIKHPELMQRVPQKFLASYLNIKPETFSRFKHLVRDHARNPLYHPN